MRTAIQDEQDWEVIDDPSKKQDERNESISNSVSSNASQFYLPADGENGSITEDLGTFLYYLLS